MRPDLKCHQPQTRFQPAPGKEAQRKDLTNETQNRDSRTDNQHPGQLLCQVDEGRGRKPAECEAKPPLRKLPLRPQVVGGGNGIAVTFLKESNVNGHMLKEVESNEMRCGICLRAIVRWGWGLGPGLGAGAGNTGGPPVGSAARSLCSPPRPGALCHHHSYSEPICTISHSF